MFGLLACPIRTGWPVQKEWGLQKPCVSEHVLDLHNCLRQSTEASAALLQGTCQKCSVWMREYSRVFVSESPTKYEGELRRCRHQFTAHTRTQSQHSLASLVITSDDLDCPLTLLQVATFAARVVRFKPMLCRSSPVRNSEVAPAVPCIGRA